MSWRPQRAFNARQVAAPRDRFRRGGADADPFEQAANGQITGGFSPTIATAPSRLPSGLTTGFCNLIDGVLNGRTAGQLPFMVRARGSPAQYAASVHARRRAAVTEAGLAAVPDGGFSLQAPLNCGGNRRPRSFRSAEYVKTACRAHTVARSEPGANRVRVGG